MSLQLKKIIYITILIGLIFIVLPLVLAYGKYNETMLWAIPFGIGMCYTLLFSIYRRPSLGKILGYSFLVLFLISISAIIFAGEGAICFIIFGLFILIPFYLGIIIGYFVQRRIWLKNTLLVLVFCAITSSATLENTYKESIVSSDEIVIDMSAKELWKKLVSPVDFGKATNFFFENGVTYPSRMQIINYDSKKYLYCTFNNGAITAPIIDFQENKSFTFEISDSITTMKEMNFYKESKTMHIKNHFAIDYGKFEIIEIDSNRCRLIATTSFRHKFEPEFYTNIWIEYFVHILHKHVLEKIKKN